METVYWIEQRRFSNDGWQEVPHTRGYDWGRVEAYFEQLVEPPPSGWVAVTAVEYRICSSEVRVLRTEAT